jgi:hypothetical protein
VDAVFDAGADTDPRARSYPHIPTEMYAGTDVDAFGQFAIVIDCRAGIDDTAGLNTRTRVNGGLR